MPVSLVCSDAHKTPTQITLKCGSSRMHYGIKPNGCHILTFQDKKNVIVGIKVSSSDLQKCNIIFYSYLFYFYPLIYLIPEK